MNDAAVAQRLHREHLESDAATRETALDPLRSFIVQAPAGSGKTELLTQRYLRLLATVEHPEQVLAITFTRKAAAEMRGRILEAIQAAAQPPPEQTHKRKTWDLARAVREADERHHWRLLQHASRLRVQTIDSLNAMLARRLPVLAGTGAALEPTDDPAPLYEAASEQLIERLGEDSAEAAHLQALIVHLGYRVDRLLSLLMDLLAKRDQWLHPVIHAGQTEALRTSLEGALNSVIERHLKTLCERLTAEYRRELWELASHAAENLLREPALNPARKFMLEACIESNDPPGASGAALPAWQAVAATLFKQDGALYRKVNKLQGFPTTSGAVKSRMEGVLADLAEHAEHRELLGMLRDLPQPRYAEEQWEILQGLLAILPLAVAELQLVFQAQGRADYVEAALRALRALGPADDPTDLALAFDYRLRHILVDEFQDTSFAQLDLLERLTAGWSEGDGRTLFCVGDPMQSIYRFRQAEVGLFLELQRHGLRNVRLQPLTLSANFRSRSNVVSWVNEVFPAVLAREDDAEQGAVRYSSSFAADRSSEGGVHVHPVVATDASTEARLVVQIIREALARDEEGSVAILVTARSHIGLIADELSLAGIDVHAVDIERLAERPVVQDLLALTCALVHLADRTAWLGVLRAPWCGMTLADLHSLAAGDAAATINELIHRALQAEAHGELSEDGRERLSRIAPVLQSALARRGRHSLRDWVEATWCALGGPATLSRSQDLEDAEAYFARLDEIQAAGDLLDSARLKDQLANLFARAKVRGRARVDVMTIHKAKGLEFDTVILPGLQRWMRNEDRELLRFTRLADLPQGIVFAPVKAQGAEADPIYRWIELLERRRTARERGRLLYVAATRAKRDLHLIGAAALKENAAEAILQPPRSGSMLDMVWHKVAGDFAAAAAKASSAVDDTLQPGNPMLRRLPRNWQLPPADPAAHSHATAFIDLSVPPLDFDWVTETSRHVGTLVHRELDRMTRTLSQATQPPSWHAEAVIESSQARWLAELAELGVPLDRCAAAAERVGEAITLALADEYGRWLLGINGTLRDTESELALSGVIDGQVINGIIDRTFIDEHGTRWIVDFKTSTHEGGGLKQFLDREVERYRPQLMRYASLLKMYKPDEPLRAALYFPLLRQWQEVEL